MRNRLFLSLQYLLPQHIISRFFGFLAEVKIPFIKNFFIHIFMWRYGIKLSENVIEDPKEFPTFNDFFIRRLKKEARPIDQDNQAIFSPVDGTITQLGRIENQLLLQAKDFYFNIEGLLGGDAELSRIFADAAFITFYLAPKHYHRVHMPYQGTLEQTIYVPGDLFSVNNITTEHIPGLYSRNERLITIFNTDIGKIAIILIGAIIVGSIQTVWMQEPQRANKLIKETLTASVILNKGDELGYFKLGSTVILLIEKNNLTFLPHLKTNTSVS